MKYLSACLLFSVALMSACSTNDSNITRNSTADTGKSKVAQSRTIQPCDTLRDTVFVPDLAMQNQSRLRPGRHKLTLQWISWDKPGYANIIATEDGWFKIKGEQRRGEDEYLKIDGLIKAVTDRELLFRGTIETKVIDGNNGEPCVKSGSKVFLTKGSRKYWRLQEMLNCDGIVTDYVDLYF